VESFILSLNVIVTRGRTVQRLASAAGRE